MTPSDNCIKLISTFEGFKSAPYLCPAGVPTIGIGSTRYENGLHVLLNDDPISLDRAYQILGYWLANEYCVAVNRYVQVNLTQNQFDALTSFVYNNGAQNFRTSTLLKKLNLGDYVGASLEFGKWVHANGVKLNGLVNRRNAEKQLFITPIN